MAWIQSLRGAARLSLCASILLSWHATAEVHLQTLASADGTAPMGRVGAMASDGSAMTGSRWSFEDYLPEAYFWVSGSNVLEIVPGSAPSASPSAYASAGRGISDDLEVIVGGIHETRPAAFCLRNGTSVALTSTRGSVATGISPDGAIAVGRDPTDEKATGIQAVSWSTDTGSRTVLPDLPDGATLASAEAISADKTTIVGWGTDANGRQACRWISGAVAPLGDLPGGRFYSEATAVSADGAVIVGRSWSSNGIEAFVWTAAGGMRGMGDLPGGCIQSEATGVSDDGQVIVGLAHSDAGEEVFVWNATNGMRSLRTLLKAAGWDPSGWRFGLMSPRLSRDGSVLAGSAIDPEQNSVLFRVGGMREMTNCLVTTMITCRARDGDMLLGFSTEPGLVYQAQASRSLPGGMWLPVGAPVSGTGSFQEIALSKTNLTGCQFYRLRVSN